MAATPADEESITISMTVMDWEDDQDEQFSPVHRYKGYPWRLLIERGDYDGIYLSLRCDKRREAELWRCTAEVELTSVIGLKISSLPKKMQYTFTSWDGNWDCEITAEEFTKGCKLTVRVRTDDNGDIWNFPPPPDPLVPRDPSHYAILAVGEEETKVEVNKAFLASQSPFFDRLFFGDFKEKNMDEIHIRDVDYKEFSNVIRMVCDFEGTSLNAGNVHQVSELADRFQLKIVANKVIAFLLSDSLLSLTQMLLISEKYNNDLLKDILLSRDYSNEKLKEVSKSPEWNLLSKETIRVLYDKLGNEAR